MLLRRGKILHMSLYWILNRRKLQISYYYKYRSVSVSLNKKRNTYFKDISSIHNRIYTSGSSYKINCATSYNPCQNILEFYNVLVQF